MKGCILPLPKDRKIYSVAQLMQNRVIVNRVVILLKIVKIYRSNRDNKHF